MKGDLPSETAFAANPTGCQVHNRRHPFSDILKNFANKWSRTAAGKSKTSTMFPLFIEDTNIAEMFSFHWQFSFPFVVLLFNV